MEKNDLTSTLISAININDQLVNFHADDLANKNSADDFFSDLRKFVNKDADYSYNHDWSDLV